MEAEQVVDERIADEDTEVMYISQQMRLTCIESFFVIYMLSEIFVL